MEPILSVALTATQGASTPEVTATIGLHQDSQRSHVHLAWELPTRINADGNVGDWLYAVLSRLVQDFDEHIVTKVSHESIGAKEGNPNA